MPESLKDVVSFRGDRLFNGAVSVSWYDSDKALSCAAAKAFVFHGPQYHGVSQADVGTSHGHRLQDTANFARAIVRRCYGQEDQPFTLAIAGYGTGKSHLALTLACLLSNPRSPLAEDILSGVEAADQMIGGEIRAALRENEQPCMVIILNGMQSFDLTAEVTRQVLRRVKDGGLDTRPLDELRPRFTQLASLVTLSNEDVRAEMVAACEVADVNAVLEGLQQQDELLYAKVHQFFASRGMPIRALGGESVEDVIDAAVREYCGKNRPFRSLVILFDEFGKYTEFATLRSQIAGSGALQNLFEGIQKNAGAACFVGFIQFELSAYAQRVAPEYKNEIARFVTRYQVAADRAYLSINLETLLAHLLEKRNPLELNQWFSGEASAQESVEIVARLRRWFPQSSNYRLWSDPDQFHLIIRKGCWPLSPYSTWLLFYLTAAGKHLQERSALALLGDAFRRFQDVIVPDDGSWSLAPADMWADGLLQELIASEESGQQGAIAHAYASVIARHGERLDDNLQRVLRAVVLASKMGLQAADRDDALNALSEMAGIPAESTREAARLLQEEYNVLEWDASFKEFDIFGDAVPRTQFLSFVRQRVASSYDEAGKARLFASKAATWCDLLGDLECDFAEENKITTREWRYLGMTSNLEHLHTHFKLAADRWMSALGVDDPRGTVIYCYVEPSRDAGVIASDAVRLLRAATREAGASAMPILVVFLCDDDGALGQALAELAVLDETLTEEDRVRFGNLIGAHREKTLQVVRSHIEAMIKERRYATSSKEELESRRLDRAGTEIFARIYKTPVPFPFDGFSTAKGNAAETCQELTTELMLGKLDYETVMAKPPKAKNRAVAVLRDGWGIFAKTGAVLRRPTHPVIKSVTERWDDALAAGDRRLSVADVLQQLCRPPYGANIASAGLLLAAFLAPRGDKLAIAKDGQRYALSQWIQDGLFRGKLIDVRALVGAEIIALGEESAEWVNLIDEWEQAATYYDRRAYLERCSALKQRIPVPPALGYRCTHLEQLAQAACEAIQKMDGVQNDAIQRIELGHERDDVGKVAWGASDLVKLLAQMKNEGDLWTEWEKNEPQPHIVRARQIVIQAFPTWVVQQAPMSDAPGAVGDWKHKMLRLIGGNLKALSLDEQYTLLEQRVLLLARNAESVAEARQLLRDVESWQAQHADACRIVRVAELRGLAEIGKGFLSKLQGIATRVELPEVNEARTRLSGFVSQLKEAADAAVKRASRLWEAKPRSAEDLEALGIECDELLRVFEGCETDLKDLRLLGRGFGVLQHGYVRLQDDRLTWTECDTLVAELEKELGEQFKEGQLPWSPAEVLGALAKTVAKSRKDRGDVWTRALESDAEAIGSMPAVDANRLHARANSVPAYLTESQVKRSRQVVREVERHLNALAVEWLLEKFKELPASSKAAFLKAALKLVGK